MILCCANAPRDASEDTPSTQSPVLIWGIWKIVWAPGYGLMAKSLLLRPYGEWARTWEIVQCLPFFLNNSDFHRNKYMLNLKIESMDLTKCHMKDIQKICGRYILQRNQITKETCTKLKLFLHFSKRFHMKWCTAHSKTASWVKTIRTRLVSNSLWHCALYCKGCSGICGTPGNALTTRPASI